MGNIIEQILGLQSLTEKELISIQTYYEKYREGKEGPRCLVYAAKHSLFGEEIKIPFDKAAEMFEKLKNLLAIHGKGKDIPFYTGKLALIAPKERLWYRVKWMPKLDPGWHRLTFEQFLELYWLIPSETNQSLPRRFAPKPALWGKKKWFKWL